VINNAGVWHSRSRRKPPPKNTLISWLNTDLKGVFYCCQAASKIMIPKKERQYHQHRLDVWHRRQLSPETAHYNAAKAGVILLTKCLAIEWVGYNIRVNCISPGYTRTEMTVKLSAPEMIKQWESLTPMKRMADPQELCGAAVYLASDAASFTTGSDIIVDGGYTAM